MEVKLEFSDWVAGAALLVSLLTLYRSSYYKSFVFGARLVEIDRRYKESAGAVVKDELSCKFIMSNTGNTSVFVDKLVVQLGEHEIISSTEFSYDIKRLLSPGETTSQVVDLKSLNFSEGQSYTFTFSIYNAAVSRFHAHDTIKVVKSDQMMTNVTFNRFCRFKFKLTSFSFVKRWRVWRNSKKHT